MATLSELIKELQTLQLGNVYTKKIKGKTYYYHQYFSNGKRYSNLINKTEVPELIEKIHRRKEIEKQIKEKESKVVKLSKSAKELTGYVMNENQITAIFDKGHLTYIDEEHVPLVIKRTHSVEEFLKLRVMDMSRTNARILKKILNIKIDDDYQTPLYAYALSISDRYWFKPKHSKLDYESIRVNDDALFETSLKGEVNVYYDQTRLSPEITTTGSFEKGWRYIDNEWWLYKAGNNKQYFSELFCSMFAKLIQINSIDYEMDNGYIRCKNFADKYNFEPVAAFAGDDDSYQHVFESLLSFSEEIASDYLKLIFFDTVVNNIDRHNENVGVLRDVKTGKVISLAPNFDNNLSLLAVSEMNNNYRTDGFIKVFVNFINNNEQAKELLSNNHFKEISLDELNKIISSIDVEIDNKERIANIVCDRYNYLKSLVNKQHN